MELALIKVKEHQTHLPFTVVVREALITTMVATNLQLMAVDQFGVVGVVDQREVQVNVERLAQA
jgi:hypothetical protein